MFFGKYHSALHEMDTIGSTKITKLHSYFAATNPEKINGIGIKKKYPKKIDGIESCLAGAYEIQNNQIDVQMDNKNAEEATSTNEHQLNLYLTDTFRQQTRRNYNVGHLSIVIFISKRRMDLFVAHYVETIMDSKVRNMLFCVIDVDRHRVRHRPLKNRIYAKQTSRDRYRASDRYEISVPLSTA
ncbi:hypothetical protein QTP88_006054 [Uroleucon formosanum]